MGFLILIFVGPCSQAAEWTVVGARPPQLSAMGFIGDGDQRLVLENDLSDASTLEIEIHPPAGFQSGELLLFILGDGRTAKIFHWSVVTNRFFLSLEGSASLKTSIEVKTQDGSLRLIVAKEKKGLSICVGDANQKSEVVSRFFFEGKDATCCPLVLSPTKGLVIGRILFRDATGREFFREDFKNPVIHFVDLTKGKKSGEGIGEMKGGGGLF